MRRIRVLERGMHMPDIATRVFRVRPFGIEDRASAMDRLGDGERRALREDTAFGLVDRRKLRWN
ncbi:MAG TPA: hypothetical protein VI997_11730 [Candidatus Thermoplasmatota archaeon]|nr:hypothetical protein [Candidatus Thermoplasmatota archaeon]